LKRVLGQSGTGDEEARVDVNMYAEEVGAEGERGEEKCVGDTELRSGGRMYWQEHRMSIMAGMPKGHFAK
jgi:hypothetical protein